MKKRPKVLFLFLCCVSFLLPLQDLYAADSGITKVLDWIAADSAAEIYRGSLSEIRYILEQGERDGVNPDLLFDKLKEAAAKRIPSRTLLQFLEAERKRLAFVSTLLSGTVFSDAGMVNFSDLLKSSSIALVNNIDAEILLGVYQAASGKDSSAVTALLPVLIRMRAISVIPADLAGAFAEAVFSGKLPRDQYGSLGSLYLKAVAGRIPSDAVLKIFTDVLKNGGGLIQIEKEILRRTKR